MTSPVMQYTFRPYANVDSVSRKTLKKFCCQMLQREKTGMKSGVNFTSILRAPSQPIFLAQKKYKAELKVQKNCTYEFHTNIYSKKCW
jgi:hypothetical protein